MAKLIHLKFLFLISVLLQGSHCKRERRGVTDFIIPGINIGDIALDALKNYIYGTPVDKDQIILDRQLEHMQTTRAILSLTQDIAVTAKNTPEMTLLIQTIQKVPKFINSIDDAFREYEELEKDNATADDYYLKQFVQHTSNRYIGPLNDIKELYSITIPSGGQTRSRSDYSLVSMMARQMKGYKKLCDKYKSQRQMLQIILDSITIAELKTFLVMEFCFRMLSQVENLNYEKQVTTLKNNLKNRFEKLISTFRYHIRDASDGIWRCDSVEHIEDKTYFKLNIFQSYVARDYNLLGASDCYYQCDYFKDTAQYRCKDNYQAPYLDIDTDDLEYVSCTSVRSCFGNLYDCSNKFKDYSELWTCPAVKNSTRRYQYFSHGSINRLLNTRTINRYGITKNGCQEKLTYDYRNWDDKFRECDMCLCTCDDSSAPYADSKINLRPVVADKDHVITGIRWVKTNHTLNIQIEQGMIKAKGEIDQRTIHWKRIQPPKDENDIATFSWRDLRGFLLHDMTLSYDFVLVGIKLSVIKNSHIKLITFQLAGIYYQWETGILRYPVPLYDNPDDLFSHVADPPRDVPEHFPAENQVVDLSNAKVPSDATKPSLPIDDSIKVAMLTTSDFDTDIGQNTVPYFDMQDNVVSPAFPLAGVGIYLKKTDGYGGFLSTKLVVFDNSLYISQPI